MKKILVLLLLFSLGLSTTRAQETYTNPILAGFYPDPSVCRAGDDYYLVNSTFSYYPGIPVFHSKDLVSWKLIGYVLNSPSQLNLDGLGVSRGLFAPAIRYHDGIFYVTCTLVGGKGNFVVTARNPAGPWSQPAWLPSVSGIDPSLFFDEEKAFLVYNSEAPDNNPSYNGHRTIRLVDFDKEHLKVAGTAKILVNGGVDITKKPGWIEGPHLFKKEGYYYLLAAEGGTSVNHSEVVFRSASVYGPYVPYEANPVLTQRHLDPNRPYPVTSAGHADLVETPDGRWFSVFLGCRPYEGNFYNTGRETFLAPVVWKDGWPVITSGNETIKYRYPLPFPLQTDASTSRYSGNFSYKDDFSSTVLGNDWLFLRTPHEKWYDLSVKKGFLSLSLRPSECSGEENPSFLGRRQQHMTCEASTSMIFNPAATNEKAGLLIFQNESHFYFLCLSIEQGRKVVQLYKPEKDDDGKIRPRLITSQKINLPGGKSVFFKIEADKSTYSFWYSTVPGKWRLLTDNIDGKFLSTLVAGGFVGCFFALYATSSGHPSQNKACYDWFSYSGNDPVYSE